MMSVQSELREFLIEKGVSDVGFFADEAAPLPYGVSIVVRLSEAIIREIDDEPTHTYFNHYRSVNAFIDSMLLQTGLFLQRRGYRYITVAASQSSIRTAGIIRADIPIKKPPALRASAV